MKKGIKSMHNRLTSDLGIETKTGFKLAMGLGDGALSGVSLFAMPALDFTSTKVWWVCTAFCAWCDRVIMGQLGLLAPVPACCRLHHIMRPLLPCLPPAHQPFRGVCCSA